MLRQIRPAILVLLLLTAITGVAYPLAMTAIAGAIFPKQAQGSLIEKDGKVIGSALIGQEFKEDKYFHGRPSATLGPDPADSTKTVPAPYNAANSGGSNLGPTSKALSDRVKEDVEKLKAENPAAAVPVDLVTTSASGLDPDISPAGALFQVPRVAKARDLEELVQLDLPDQDIEFAPGGSFAPEECDPWLANFQKILTDGDPDGDGVRQEVPYQPLLPDAVKTRAQLVSFIEMNELQPVRLRNDEDASVVDLPYVFQVPNGVDPGDVEANVSGRNPAATYGGTNAYSPVRDVSGRRDVPGGRDLDCRTARAVGPPGGVPPGSDVLRPDALQHRVRGGGAAAHAAVPPDVRRRPGDLRAVGRVAPVRLARQPPGQHHPVDLGQPQLAHRVAGSAATRRRRLPPPRRPLRGRPADASARSERAAR